MEHSGNFRPQSASYIYPQAVRREPSYESLQYFDVPENAEGYREV